MHSAIESLHGLYAEGDTTPSDVIRDTFDSIEREDGKIRAFLHLFRDEAMRRAAGLDGSGMEGKPLFGVPIAVKDNICTHGLTTSCASRILEGYLPPYDATVIERLYDAGAIIVGKTNMDEFAMGSSCENSAFAVTANPWNTERSPGGSSGGAAAAVAAGLVPIALGSDTGGSIRQPASFCGIVGLKGTYGRVSRYGLVAFASSFDAIGPLARNVRDCAVVMQVIAGRDAKDATTLPEDAPDLSSSLGEGLRGLRIGWPSGMDGWEMDPEVRRITRDTAEIARMAGADVTTVDLPDLDAAIACYYVLATAEASSNLARFDGVRYGLRVPADSMDEMYGRTREDGFGEEVKRRILLGTYVLSAGYYEAYYTKAQRVRALIRDQFEGILDGIDAVMLPTAPAGAFPLGEKTADPVSMYMSDIFTTPANIAGLPAVSIPAGCDGSGLPVGLQLVSRRGGESVLLRCAAGFERIIGFNDRHSPGRSEGKDR